MVGVGKRRTHTVVEPTLTSLALLTANAKISTDYVFDASAQTIAIFDNNFLKPLLVTNLADGQVIYNPSVPAQRGSMSNDLLTLNYDTTEMSDDDELCILYEADQQNIEERMLMAVEGMAQNSNIMKREMLLLNMRFHELFPTLHDRTDIRELGEDS